VSASTGPILAAAGIVAFNAVVVHEKTPMSQTPVFVAAALAAGGLSLWERAMPATATAVAWLALLGVLLVRVDPVTPSPVESFSLWYNAK
jgi:hypothetical protein